MCVLDNFTFLDSYPLLEEGSPGMISMDPDGAERGQRGLAGVTDVAAPLCSGGRSADLPMLWRSDLIGRWHVFDLGGCATSTSFNIATSTHHCTRFATYRGRKGSRRRLQPLLIPINNRQLGSREGHTPSSLIQ